MAGERGTVVAMGPVCAAPCTPPCLSLHAPPDMASDGAENSPDKRAGATPQRTLCGPFFPATSNCAPVRWC